MSCYQTMSKAQVGRLCGQHQQGFGYKLLVYGIATPTLCYLSTVWSLIPLVKFKFLAFITACSLVTIYFTIRIPPSCGVIENFLESRLNGLLFWHNVMALFFLKKSVAFLCMNMKEIFHILKGV